MTEFEFGCILAVIVAWVVPVMALASWGVEMLLMWQESARIDRAIEQDRRKWEAEQRRYDTGDRL